MPHCLQFCGAKVGVHVIRRTLYHRGLFSQHDIDQVDFGKGGILHEYINVCFANAW
jgi:hypothetical protein